MKVQCRPVRTEIISAINQWYDQVVRLRYNFRLYPTPGQRQSLAKALGCARVVFNDGLRVRQDAHAAGLAYLPDGALLKLVTTEAKRTPERAWLGEVSAVVLQQAVADLNTAYRNFFNSLTGKRKGRTVAPPRFRSKKDSGQSIRFTRNARFTITTSGRLSLPKIGDVPVRWSRDLPCEPSSVTVTMDAAGRYHASFVVEVTDQPLPVSPNSVGIDLGLSTFAALSDGRKLNNPRFARKAQKRLARAQRALSRCQRGSKNRVKARFTVARAHAKVRDTRRNWLHQESTRIIRDNQAVYVEDLQCRRARPYSHGPLSARRWLVHVREHAGVQGGANWAHVRPDRPLVSLDPPLLGVRRSGREEAVEHPVVVLPLWCGPRPGHQRRDQHSGRRTGGQANACGAGVSRDFGPAVGVEAGTRRKRDMSRADRNLRPSGRGGRQTCDTLTCDTLTCAPSFRPRGRQYRKKQPQPI